MKVARGDPDHPFLPADLRAFARMRAVKSFWFCFTVKLIRWRGRCLAPGVWEQAGQPLQEASLFGRKTLDNFLAGEKLPAFGWREMAHPNEGIAQFVSPRRIQLPPLLKDSPRVLALGGGKVLEYFLPYPDAFLFFRAQAVPVPQVLANLVLLLSRQISEPLVVCQNALLLLGGQIAQTPIEGRGMVLLLPLALIHAARAALAMSCARVLMTPLTPGALRQGYAAHHDQREQNPAAEPLPFIRNDQGASN